MYFLYFISDDKNTNIVPITEFKSPLRELSKQIIKTKWAKSVKVLIVSEKKIANL